MNEEITLRLETFNDKEYILADDCIKAIGIHRKTNTKLHKEIERLKEEYMILQNASDEVEEEKDNEIERLNNIIEVQKSKLLMIKGIINTPRALDSSLAYVMVKSHIQEVLNGSLGIDIGSDKE